jgi:hypothetical protein
MESRSFLKSYATAYPDDNVVSYYKTINRLNALHVSIMSMWRETSYSASKSPQHRFTDYLTFLARGDGYMFNDYKTIWLFHKDGIKIDSDELMDVIIERNDVKLNTSDYILLLYLSHQPEEMRNMTKVLPVSILHEMYDPLADEEISNWSLEGYL